MKENKKNKVILIIVIIMSLVIITWNKSYSYEMNNSIPEEKEIERKEFAIYLEKEQDKYETTETYPNKGYLLNTNKTKCYEYGTDELVPDAVEQSLSSGVIDGSIIVTSTKSIYCNIYFDKDEERPEVSTFTLTGSSESNTTLSDQSKYTHTTNVTYNVTWSDNDVAQICVSEGETCSNWQEVGSNSKTKNETITISTGDGPKNIYVYLKDKANNISEIEKKETITLDANAPIITLSDKEVTEDTIVINVNVSDTSGINNVTCKAIKDTTEVTGNYDKNSNKCSFSGLEAGTQYTITIEATDGSGRKNTSNELSITTKQALSEGQTKAQEVLGVVPVGISDVLLGDMYRFVGGCNAAEDGCDGKVDNFICFGYGNPSDCVKKNDDGTINLDNDYIYRIIGITEDGQMKLIKNTAIREGSTKEFYWNKESVSTKASAWGSSTLKSRLLGGGGSTYGNYGDTNLFIDATSRSSVRYLQINSTWYNKLERHIWFYGDIYGSTNGASQTADEIYKVETGKKAVAQGKSTSGSELDSKTWTSYLRALVGLLYLHDYYYSYAAEGRDSSGTNCYSGSFCKDSWLNISNNGKSDDKRSEWTMVRYGIKRVQGTDFYDAWYIGSSGGLGTDALNNGHLVRPIIYLSSSTSINGGVGTSGKPFIIENEIEKENS